MRKELQIKFLNFLNNRKKSSEEGFTLIELLVVIIIIGILAAIALPSLLGQAAKAKQSEARNNVGAISRGQQAYALEQTVFTTDLVTLGLGIESQTVNYQYEITGLQTVGVGAIPGQMQSVYNWGVPIKPALKGYVGAVGITVNNASGEVLTVSSVFETQKANSTANPVAGTRPTPTQTDGLDLVKVANLPQLISAAGEAGWKDLGG